MKKNIFTLLLFVCCTLVANATMSVSLNTTQPSCTNPCSGSISAVVTGSISTLTYLWSDSSTGTSISNLCAGDYCVTVTDAILSQETDGADGIVTACVTITAPSGGGAPTATITSSPIPSGGVGISGTGGNPTKLYLGYGPQSTTINLAISGGSAPYTVSWAPAAGLNTADPMNPVFTPTAEGYYTFTATVGSSGPCGGSTTASISICVLDIRVPASSGGCHHYTCGGSYYGCGSTSSSVYLCNTYRRCGRTYANTVSVSTSSVASYLSCGSNYKLGRCGQACVTGKTDGSEDMVSTEQDLTLDAQVFPNPFVSEFNFIIRGNEDSPVQMRIYDATGRLMLEDLNVPANEQVYGGADLAPGAYVINFTQGAARQTVKLIKTH
jgi:Secretion system C-terminal sorting domain